MKYIYLTIVSILFANSVNSQIIIAEIRATGLTCSMCSNAINKQLKTLSDVEKVDIDLNTNTFKVFLKKDNILSPKVFKEKVEKAGFFIGSLLLTTQPSAAYPDSYILVDNDKTVGNEFQIQILDKGYVTDKEYKKLKKALKKIESYASNNEDVFHYKILKP